MSIEIQAPQQIPSLPVAETAASIPLSSLSSSSFSSISESGFNLQPSLGGEIKPVTLNLEQLSLPADIKVEDIFDLPHHELDLGNISVDRLVPEIELFGFKPIAAEKSGLPQPQLPRIENMEESLDIAQIISTISTIKNSDSFTPEEQTFWQAKFESALSEKYQVSQAQEGIIALPDESEEEAVTIQPLVPFREAQALQTEETTAVQSQVTPDAQVSEQGEPHIPPAEIGLKLEEPEPEPETVEAVDEKEWKVFSVTDKKKFDETTHQERLKAAEEIVYMAQDNPTTTVAAAAEANLYQLDVPQTSKYLDIIEGKLEIPSVATAATLELYTVKDPNDPKEVSRAIKAALAKKAPKRKEKEVRFVKIEKESDLEPVPKEIAHEGAEHIVLKKGKTWVPERRIKRTEPVEMDLIKKAA